MSHTIEHDTADALIYACMDTCHHCHHMCLQMAMNHCLETGGKNVEARHFRLMRDCAEICQTALNFMLGNSLFAGQICAVCANICDACAQSCEKIGGMEECVKACRECSQSCRDMAHEY